MGMFFQTPQSEFVDFILGFDGDFFTSKNMCFK